MPQYKIILAVDDDPDDLEIFSEAVRSIDPEIRLITKQDGLEAIQFLQNDTELPDIVFLDINMPNLSGKECLKLIRSMPHCKDTRVIMHSTTSNEKEIEIYQQMGAEFVTKHSSFERLVTEIADILN